MLADNAAPMLAAWDSESSASGEPSRGTRTVRTEDSGAAGPGTVARTMSMGLGMVCSTLSVTLPSTQRAIPPLPWVDMTTNAVGSVLAWVTMASAGVPRNTDTETLWPSASNRSRIGARPASARCCAPDTIWSMTRWELVPSIPGGRMSKACTSSMGTASDLATSWA